MTAARRNQVLLAAQGALTLAKNEALVGTTVEVLVEGDSKVDGRLSGRTAHHRLVHFASGDRELFGQYVPATTSAARTVGGSGFDRGYAEVNLPRPLVATGGFRAAAQWLVFDPATLGHATTPRCEFRVQQ